VCRNGQCDITCAPGLLACAGTCIDPLADRTFCGATDCSSLGASADAGDASVGMNVGCDGGMSGGVGTTCPSGQVCAQGTCAVSCTPGFIECNGTCIDPQRNRDHCGASAGCGVTGGSAGTTCASGAVCNQGSCSPSCQPGFVNCNGTCIDPLTDRTFCGASGACMAGTEGTVCAAGNVCNAGACSVSCQAGFINCDGTCVNPLTDRNYCGASGACMGGTAGAACAAGNVCASGFCSLSCQAGLVNCGGTCVNPLTDRNYCGASGTCMGAQAGTTCQQGSVCNAGTCQVSCQAGLVNCGGTCVNPLTDRNYCGASGTCMGGQAGTACQPGSICTSGTCQVSCPVSQVSCGGSCVTPATDPNFCGASGTCMGGQAGAACSPSQRCSNGTCCPSGFVSCGGVCVNPATNNNFCGASGTCTGPSTGEACGGGLTCSAGSCVSAVTSNYVVTSASPLVNLFPGGGCSGYQNNCSSSFGFSWTDNSPGTLTGATISFQLKGTCAAANTVHAVTLNGTLIGSYTNTLAQACNCTLQPVVINASTLSSYVQGGTNTLLISSSTCETLDLQPGNVIATVAVNSNSSGPPVTSGLIAHYDARTTSSLTLGGSSVSGWADLSGQNNHLINNGAQPQYNATLINGRPALDFSGAAGMFSAGNFALNNAVTVFAVGTWRTPGGWGLIAHHGNRNHDWSMEHNDLAGSPNIVHWQTDNDNAGVRHTLTPNTPYVFCGRMGAMGGRYFSISSTAGGLQTTAGANSNDLVMGLKRLYIGKSDVNEASNMYMGQFLYYNRELTNPERDAVVNYLRTRWGI